MQENWLRKEIQTFKPYQVAPITVPLVNNANESPLNLWEVPEVKEDLIKELTETSLNCYPSSYADELREQIAAYVNKEVDQILVGNGGDEMITYVTNAFLNRGDSIVIHSPTFSMYSVMASSMGGRTVAVENLPDGTQDVEGLLGAIAENNPKIVYLCNPNNPTGVLWNKKDLLRVIEAAPYVVLVDEAYMEFTDPSESMLNELEEYPNVFVLRTLSKAFSIAGTRVGYLVGNPEAISYVARVKAPYNLNVLSQAVARVALRHQDVMHELVTEIVAQRDRLYEALTKVPGVQTFKSAGNFLLITTDKASAIYEALKEKGVLVKCYSPNSSMAQCLRLSVTTEIVTTMMIETIQEVCGNGK